MSTLPWTIQVWAALYPLPQVLGGLWFSFTAAGLVILLGRLMSLVIASQVHKRSPFSKLIGPISHAHWLLILPFLFYLLCRAELPVHLHWFVIYVCATSVISLLIDVRDTISHYRYGEASYKRD